MFIQRTAASLIVDTAGEDPIIVSGILGLDHVPMPRTEPLLEECLLALEFRSWNLSSRLDYACDVQEHLRDLVDQLQWDVERLRAVQRRFPASEVLVSIYSESSTPIIEWDSDIAAYLGEAGVSLNFSIYVLELDEEVEWITEASGE